MAQIDTLSIFIPLLAIILLEIAHICRQIDLTPNPGSKTGSIEYTKYQRLANIVPRLNEEPVAILGQYGALHVYNFWIGIIALMVIGYTVPSSPNLIYAVSLFVIVLLLVLLPYFEVKEYGRIFEVQPYPKSISFYAFFSVITQFIAAAWSFDYGRAFVLFLTETQIIWPTTIVSEIVFLILIYLGFKGNKIYLSLLRDEIRNIP